MKPRTFAGLVAVSLTALGWGGCSDRDETTWVCLSSCGPTTVTFELSTPISWRQIEIAVGLPDGSVERLDCQPGDGSIACIPVPGRVRPSFAADGALESLTVGPAGGGTYAVQIAVDGTPAAAGAFEYVPVYTPNPGPPLSTCPYTPAPACASSQTFTIAN
jgi:hypothetical protein